MSIAVQQQSDDHLLYSGAGPDYTSAYTFMGWYLPDVILGTMLLAHIRSSSANDWDELSLVQSAGGSPVLDCRITNVVQQSITSTFDPVIGDWNCIAVVRDSATSIRLYTGTTIASLSQTGSAATGDVTGRTAADRLRIGGGGGIGIRGRVYGWKLFTRAMTIAEVQAELAYARWVSSTNLWASWTLGNTKDLKDWSGNGRDVTINGIPTDSGDPPSIPLTNFQHIDPISDVALGSWTDEAGGVTNLFSKVADASDTTFVKSSVSPSSDLIKFGIGNPGVLQSGPWMVSVRARKA